MVEKNLIATFKVEYPTVKKKKSNALITLNNYMKIHWATLNKIKKEFKDNIIEWYLSKNPKEQYDYLEIHSQVIRHNKRKLDADNAIFCVKWLADVLTDLNYVEDDCNNGYVLKPTIYSKDIETYIKFEIYGINNN